MRSIRKRLTLALLVLLVAVWGSTFAWYSMRASGEIDRMLDARLEESAQIIRGMMESRGAIKPTIGPEGEPDAGRGGAFELRLEGSAPELLPDHLTAQIWRPSGELVAFSGGAPRALLGRLGDGFSTQRIDGEPWRVFATTSPELGATVAVAEPIAPREQMSNSFAVGLSAPFAVLFPLTAFATWLFIDQGLRPMTRIGREIEGKRPESLEPISAAGAPEEVEPLIEAMNHLLARLEGSFERERRFTSDAAHELRTPLAALKGQAQVARRHSSAERRDAALEQVERAADRAAALVEQLLTLARAEERQREITPIELSTVVREITEPWQGEGGVAIVVHRSPLPLQVRLERASLDIILSNLLRNVYAHAGAADRVVIALAANQGRAELRFEDNGGGVEPDELSRLRERFYRNSRNVGTGNGLGLSIVEAITRAHDGRLDIANGTAGLRVTLSFPLERYHV